MSKLTVEIIQEKLATNDLWLARGLISIYDKQTEDEKSDETTKHNNGVGFNGVDAPFLSDLAKKAKSRLIVNASTGVSNASAIFSANQKTAARKSMKKYASQLLKIANKEI